MMTLLTCLIIAVVVGILCFGIEKSDKINLHIDRHHDAFLAGLTGGSTAFFLSVVLMMSNLF